MTPAPTVTALCGESRRRTDRSVARPNPSLLSFMSVVLIQYIIVAGPSGRSKLISFVSPKPSLASQYGVTANRPMIWCPSSLAWTSRTRVNAVGSVRIRTPTPANRIVLRVRRRSYASSVEARPSVASCDRPGFPGSSGVVAFGSPWFSPEIRRRSLPFSSGRRIRRRAGRGTRNRPCRPIGSRSSAARRSRCCPPAKGVPRRRTGRTSGGSVQVALEGGVVPVEPAVVQARAGPAARERTASTARRGKIPGSWMPPPFPH